MPEPTIDLSSHPSTFQKTWKNNANPDALPFEPNNPPFPLTPTDWHQLRTPDSQFTPHTWPTLHHLLAISALDELKRWPSALKAYLAWTTHVTAKYGSATQYLLQQRLFWSPLLLPNNTKSLTFNLESETALQCPADFKILLNDWPYALAEGIVHIVVWSKMPLPVDGLGVLTQEGKGLVEGFVEKEFRSKVGEQGVGEMVLWFKNTPNLQSVRSLEHIHVLVRGAGEDVLRGWRG